MDVTLFEIHLDGAQFGPATIGDEVLEKMGKRGKTDETGRTMDTDTETETSTVGTDEGESGGTSRSPPRFLPVVVLLGIAVGYVVSRKLRGGDEETFDADAEAVEIEA